MSTTLAFEPDAVQIRTGASVRTVPYERIRDVSVAYELGCPGWFIDCSPGAVQLVVKELDGFASDIRGELSLLAPLAGELRARIRAVNPAANPGSYASDRALRFKQKEELSRKERRIGKMGTVLLSGILLVMLALEVPFWFFAAHATASIVTMVDHPADRRTEYAFFAASREYRGNCRVSAAELAPLRKKGKIEIEYLTFCPQFNRQFESAARTSLYWLAVPILLVMLAVSLILKSGIVPTWIDGRLVLVRRGELVEEHFPWYRALLKHEADVPETVGLPATGPLDAGSHGVPPAIEECIKQRPPRKLTPEVRVWTLNPRGHVSLAGKVALGILFALSLLLLWFMFPWGLSGELLLLAHSRTAAGKVLSMKDTKKQDQGISRRSPMVYVATFEFVDENGEMRNGVNYFTGPYLRYMEVNDLTSRRKSVSVTVAYFPLLPDIAVIPGGRRSFFTTSTVVILLLPGMLALYFVALHRQKKMRLRLMADGLVADAAVVRVTTRYVAKGNSRMTKARLRFVVADGVFEVEHTEYDALGWRKAGTEPASWLKVCHDRNMAVRMLYLPDKPSRFFVLGSG